MAVASLAAILKPQILCLMQGNEEERRGRGGGGGEEEKKKKSPPSNQSGLLDTVTRRAAAMAQIRRWQRKLLRDEKAEKRLFFHSLALSSLTSLPPSPSAHHLHWLSILHKVQREDSFFCTQELCLKKCKFSRSIHTGVLLWGSDFLSALNFFSARSPP